MLKPTRLLGLVSVLVAASCIAQESDSTTFKTKTTSPQPQEQVLAAKLRTIIDAKPLKRVPPKFPINEARSGRDGWVVLSYVVEPDGSTSNIIIEDSSGSRGFEKEAKKAMKKWQYTPAIENGEAIQQCNNSVQLDFKMMRKREGVTKKFKRLYTQFSNALTSDDTKRIEELYPKIRDYELYAHRESFFQYSLLAQYADKKNNKALQLQYLNKAMRFSGSSNYFKTLRNQDIISSVGMKYKAGESQEEELKKRKAEYDENQEKMYAPILHNILVLELDLNKIVDASDTINKLLLLSINKDVHVHYKKQKIAIDDFINTSTAIITAADIGKHDFWHHQLLRNEFSFTNISGKLHKMDVRCSNKRHVYTINDQSTWKIPKTWQDCSIYVYGEDNASFTLVETKQSDSQETAALNSD